MAYIGSGMEEVEKTVATINMVCDTMVGDGSTTTMTIGTSQEVPGSVNNVSVYFDGVAQRPTTDYTLSYKTITFTTAPENAVQVTCLSYANEFLGVISDATVYSTGIEDNAVTAAKLGSTIASSKLTGTLPALDASALTGVGVTPITTSASDPTISTNPSGGLGTIWANSTSGEMYVLTDATTDANVWTNVGAGSGDFALPFGGIGGGTVSGFAASATAPVPHNTISKFAFASNTTAIDHGDLFQAILQPSGVSSDTNGYTIGGHPTSDMIQKFAFSSNVTGSDVGNLAVAVRNTATQATTTHGYVSGARGNTLADQKTEKFSFASGTQDAVAHCQLSYLSHVFAGTAGNSSHTDGFRSGGYLDGGATILNQLEKFSFSSTATATDHGDLSQARYKPVGVSSVTYGYVCTGGIGGGSSSTNIDKFSYASNVTTDDVGDLVYGRYGAGSSSSRLGGFISGGSSNSDKIDKFLFASDNTSSTHGDLSVAQDHCAGTQY